MSDSGAALRPGPGRCLVLGAGGPLGAAWAVGALRALEEVEGWDPRSADLFVGTSAGAVLAALMAAGVGTETLFGYHRGSPVAGGHVLDSADPPAAGGGWPVRPRPRLGSPSLLRRSLRSIHHDPLPALYACLPEGRGSPQAVGQLIDVAYPEGGWPTGAGLWIPVMDYDSGQREVFGTSAGTNAAPEVTVRQAVTASCAVPAWYAPVHLRGRRYIDGGMYSAASVDLLAGRAVHEVLLLAPMVSLRYDRPRSPLRRAERAWRRKVTNRLLREVQQVREAGTAVRVLGPGPEDLASIGANVMNPDRRASVVETSLRASREALRRPEPGRGVLAG